MQEDKKLFAFQSLWKTIFFLKTWLFWTNYYLVPGLRKFTRKTKSAVMPKRVIFFFFIHIFMLNHLSPWRMEDFFYFTAWSAVIPKCRKLIFQENIRNFFRMGFSGCIIWYSPSHLPHLLTPLTENPRSNLDSASFHWLKILNISTFTNIRLLIIATGMPNNANNKKTGQH